MDDKEKKALERHVAGATVIHKSPFEYITTQQNEKTLTKDFIDKFVNPIYLNLKGLGNKKDILQNEIKEVFKDINSKVVSTLLGDFNWRTRSVGAFFAAIKNLTEFQDEIGRLLLKSEVCYAGTSYCLTLADINNQNSIDYLNQYLAYYLTQNELRFDQGAAMGAIAYLDKQNGTDELKKHLDKWNDFVSDKENWDLKRSIDHFEKNITALKEIKKYAS
ncbi:hypothetical protein AHMF7605_17050 [Adhaeribacter arboris]|uniref:Uncharacterized protein n=1 Tax=Adhaeribacter arboris TaxID=2072846 RepID=A0A2T2YHV3_9BACT|nr:DUF6000 family protein [Adhaeribacter arboris]PSR55089.1 hypothetical protein AHMF7605_17050 [Adhaeribacter arboris]